MINFICGKNVSLTTGTTQCFPYIIVADEAFPLKIYILRPYPGRNLSGMYSFDYTFLIVYLHFLL